MNTINLMPKTRLLEKKRQRRVRRWVTFCTAYGVLVAGACGVALAVSHDGSVRALRDRNADIASQIEDTRQRATRASQQLDETQRVRATIDAIGARPDWSILLGMLASSTGSDIVLRSCELEPPGEAAGAAAATTPESNQSAVTLHVAGYGRSQAGVSEFILRLEENGLIDTVMLMSSKREPFLAQQAIAFELECIIDGGGGG